MVTGAWGQGSCYATCLTPLQSSIMKRIQVGMEQTSLAFSHHLLHIRKWAEEREQHEGDIYFQNLPPAATPHYLSPFMGIS